MRISERVLSLGLVLAGALALAGACTPADVTGPEERACQDYAVSFCGQLASCSTTHIPLDYGDQITCETLQKAQCLNTLSAPSSGDSPALREACAQALKQGAWACGDILISQNPPTACQPAPGTLPNGASCGVRQQCASAFCVYPPGQLCGTCADAPALGAPCLQGQCAQSDTCVSATQTCAPHSAVGSSCSGGVPCSAGLNCAFPSGSSTGTCEVGVTMAGAPCVFGGAGCSLDSGLACNAVTATCQPAHLAAPGEACSIVADQAASCALSTCTRGTCVAKPRLGNPCEIGGPLCSTPSACVASTDGGTDGTCQLRGSATCQ